MTRGARTSTLTDTPFPYPAFCRSATQRVERRIASTLLLMVRQSGRRGDAGVEIPFVISRNELAEMTATTLHTVSRTLAAWEQEGILTGKRTVHLVITQPHRLVEIAEQA